ncbi:MAG: DNA translocase FtsK [Acutalibacteraceae bacterium]|nr:DNA translocase FtsK [Acutalibacteraceae bacterium]
MAEKATKKKNNTKKADNKAEKKSINPDEINLKPQAKAIIFFAGALLLFALILYQGENVWNAVHNFFKGMFGCLAFLWPCILTYLGVITAMEKQIDNKVVNKLVLSSIAIILLSTCMFLFGSTHQKITIDFFTRMGELYANGTSNFSNGSAAGIFGGLLGYPLAFLCGYTAAEILCVILLIVDLMFLFGVTAKDVIIFIQKPLNAVKKSIGQVDFSKNNTIANNPVKMLTSAIEKKKQSKNNGKDKVITIKASSSEIDDYNDDFIDITPVDEQLNDKKGSSNNIYDDNIYSSNNSLNKLLNAAKLVNSDDNNDKNISTNKEKNTEPSAEKHSILDKLTMPKQDDEIVTGKKSKKKELAQAEEEISRQVNEHRDESTNTYHYPPIELLHPSGSPEDSAKAMEELERNGNKLESTLKSFGVNANIVNICRGPSVTRFEVQPAPGVKISKITNLADDIALNLAASGVRIEAPIPGKAAVGIEVPNKVITMVSMRELIDSNKFKSAKSKLSVVLGKDISGNTIVTDLSKMPHLLVAGTTGSGKSVCVNSILISLLYKATPDEVKLLLIDPKMVEFSKYKGIPHLLIPVVTDPKKAAGALNWAVNEMENRYKNFSAFGVRDIAGYNNMVDSYNEIRASRTPEELEAEPIVNEDGIPIPEEKMSHIVIAIDEFADLMMTAPNEVEDSICRLAQKARAAGMHLVVATQRPTVNVITGVIKANIPSRISLKVSSQLDSRTILDVGGAEKLIGRGDMLFAPIGAAKPIRVQGCYASDAEIENVTGYIKKDHSSQYNMEIQEEIEKITELELTKNKDKDHDSDVGSFSDDVMMEEAIKVVVENGQASTSLLQRRLRLGYARAGRLIDEMEQMGIVGPHVGSKSREVLMTYQQWLERKNNMSN